jgi:hypothetical protein
MYSKNIITFVMHLLGKTGAQQATLPIDTTDEITRETLLTRGGDVVHPRVRELLGQPAKPRGTERAHGRRPEATPRMWMLKTADDADNPFTFRILPGSVKTMGRAPRADFIVEASMVSRLHCRLSAGAAELEVVDLESTNGTYVNGARVARAILKDGDRLGIGRVELVVSKG